MKSKMLIAYYSLQGHTREVSTMIQRVTGGDIFEIEPKKSYNKVSAYTIGLMHAKNGYEPPLKKQVPNLESYDVIFIGSPIWWFTITPPVKSFLKENNFENKILIPFCTHQGGYGDFFEKVKKVCTNSKIMEGNDFHNSIIKDQKAVGNKIEKWINKIIER